MVYSCSWIILLAITTLRFCLFHPLLQRRYDGFPYIVKHFGSSMFSLLELFEFLTNSIASFGDFTEHTFILSLTSSLHDC